MEVEKASESACEEKETGASLLVLSPDLSAGDNEAAASKELNVEGRELPLKTPEQHLEENLESCSEAAAPSQCFGKPEKGRSPT